MAQTRIEEIVRSLLYLPPERVAEVHDFVLALRERHGRPAGASDEWSDEDIRDLVAASMAYAGESILAGEFPDDPAE